MYPILYTFRRCPYAMRARLALYTAKISHEHREVDLKNKPAEMLAISPKGTVPVMQFSDGVVLEQSLDIMNWALDNPTLSLQDSDLIQENDTTFKRALDRYKYPGRYDDQNGMDSRDQCEVFLAQVEERLNPYMGGQDYNLVDMAIFPFVRQFVQVDVDWFEKQNYSRIKQWLKVFELSALFEEVMQKYTPWTLGDDPIIISPKGFEFS
jgi:glutathione S-transferase